MQLSFLGVTLPGAGLELGQALRTHPELVKAQPKAQPMGTVFWKLWLGAGAGALGPEPLVMQWPAVRGLLWGEGIPEPPQRSSGGGGTCCEF